MIGTDAAAEAADKSLPDEDGEPDDPWWLNAELIAPMTISARMMLQIG